MQKKQSRKNGSLLLLTSLQLSPRYVRWCVVIAGLSLAMGFCASLMAAGSSLSLCGGSTSGQPSLIIGGSSSSAGSDVELYVQRTHDNNHREEEKRPIVEEAWRRNMLLMKKKNRTDNDDNNDDDASVAVSCNKVRGYIDVGEWHDPNEGQIYARTLISKPSFSVAVHKESYDPTRWKWIFEKGKYYEDLVHDRFVRILTESSKQQQQQHQEEAVVVDVGANIGYYTLLSRALGFPVLAFEINPANLIRLCESLRFNGWLAAPSSSQPSSSLSSAQREELMPHPPPPYVTIFQRGVSDTDGKPLQVVVPRNPGQAYMKELGKTRGVADEDINVTSTHHAFVTTVTLDAFAEARGWFEDDSSSEGSLRRRRRIIILKLDVEGKEPAIVDGALRLLRSGMVINVLTEFRRLGRPAIQKAIRTLLETRYTLVDEREGKVSLERSRIILDQLEVKLRGSMKNIDLWFQRVDG